MTTATENHAIDVDDMPPPAALRAAKKELRSLMKQKLSGLSEASIKAQSAAVWQSIINLNSYQKARRIGIYLSMPTGEIQTDRIVQHALGSGKAVFVPFLHKNPVPSHDTPRSVMDMVALLSLSDYEGLARDSWGIPTVEPSTLDQRERILGDLSSESGQLDMILIPGVAFQQDPESTLVRRLGHGKGFYDYFLHRYIQGQKSQAERQEFLSDNILLYGLTLKEQFLDSKDSLSVPVGEQDRLLHGLVVGDGNLLIVPRDRQEKS